MQTSVLVQHAQRELELAGLFDKDSDYGGAAGHAVMALIQLFDQQNHSGASAWFVGCLFAKLTKFEPLTPITSHPDEWIDRTKESGYPLWQAKRASTCFSNDGGKTWYDLNDGAK